MPWLLLVLRRSCTHALLSRDTSTTLIVIVLLKPRGAPWRLRIAILNDEIFGIATMSWQNRRHGPAS